MNKRWTELDLGGGGLQSANLRLAALLRKRGTAYALLALFPLGLHRNYLNDPRGAWLYRAGAGLAIAAYLLGQPLVSAGVLAMLACGALYDLVGLERLIANINKQLRIQVYLRQAPGAPPDFKGRFPDELDDPDLRHKSPANIHQPPSPEPGSPRLPSFAEQERLLRELARGRSQEDK